MADVAESIVGFPAVSIPIWERKDGKATLARELHDGVAGELATMLLDLERFRSEQAGRQSVLAEIGHMQDQLRAVLGNVRRLLHDQRDLPGVEPDFVGALSRGLIRRFAERTGLRVHVSTSSSWPMQMPADTAMHLRRMIQEALNNVDRHSGAKSVLIRFGLLPGSRDGVVSVADDGRGYNNLVDGVEPGFGLIGIEERAVLLGAKLMVSNRRRTGSVLKMVLPRRSLGL